MNLKNYGDKLYCSLMLMAITIQNFEIISMFLLTTKFYICFIQCLIVTQAGNENTFLVLKLF